MNSEPIIRQRGQRRALGLIGVQARLPVQNDSESLVRMRQSSNVKPPMIRQPVATIIPRPFTGTPRLTLICHCWPHGDGWQKHVEYLKPVAGVFDRKIMGIATGPATASGSEVRQAFGDDWEHFEVPNNRTLREVATYKTLLNMVASTDDNDVTFCIHTKGTQSHTAQSEQVAWWIDAMYSTVVYNWQNVLEKMKQGYPIVGSFKRYGKDLGTRFKWHYSGTFYALRNAATFSDGIPEYDGRWFGTEAWPGHHFTQEESACMFGDGCGDLYHRNEILHSQLVKWKQQNET